MNIIFRCIGISVLMMASHLASASEHVTPVNTTTFAIELPAQMQAKLNKENNKNGVYQYRFSSPGSTNATMQIEVKVVDEAPHANESDSWAVSAIQSMIGNFTDDYHVNLTGHPNALNKKPEKIAYGDHTFHATQLTFNDEIQAKFMVTFTSKATYMFTLVSVDKNPTARETNMNLLLNAVKNMKYFDIKR